MAHTTLAPGGGSIRAPRLLLTICRKDLHSYSESIGEPHARFRPRSRPRHSGAAGPARARVAPSPRAWHLTPHRAGDRRDVLREAGLSLPCAPPARSSGLPQLRPCRLGALPAPPPLP